MRRPPVVLSLAVMVSGLYLLLSFSYAKGQDNQIPFEDDPTQPAPVSPPGGCPPLPEQGPAGQVSVYVAKALDAPGVLCVRAVNGISPAIGLGGPPFFLQKWEEGTFQNFSPGGAPQAGVLVGWELPAGKTVDRELFAGQPASPGRYRACLRYYVGQGGEGQIACSEEISFP